jgi:very-short-patch-repair endonuclease
MHHMGAQSANLGAKLSGLARMQHGVVSRRQLYGLGIGRGSIVRRIENGQLHRVHHGVYAVGHRGISQEGRWMAAVLACGEGAVLSHRSAASLWRLLKPVNGPTDVSIPTTSGRKRRAGIRLHRRALLTSNSVTHPNRIPVTTPAQTIADLENVVSAAQRRRAIRQAEVLGLRTGLERESERTRSELEHLFLQLCRKHQLPKPEVNVRIGRYEVDFLWRAQRLIVETDGYRYHRGAQAFEDDHDRDLELRSLGFDLRRFSYSQVTTAPQRVAAAVTKALQPRSRNRPTTDPRCG